MSAVLSEGVYVRSGAGTELRAIFFSRRRVRTNPNPLVVETVGRACGNVETVAHDLSKRKDPLSKFARHLRARAKMRFRTTLRAPWCFGEDACRPVTALPHGALKMWRLADDRAHSVRVP